MMSIPFTIQTSIPPVSFTNDVFFKYLLTMNDEDSIFFRHAIIEAITGLHPKRSTIKNSQLLPTDFKGKVPIMDVLAQDEEGRRFNFEVQMYGTMASEAARFEFYGCRLVSNQMKKGAAYELLKTLYQIIFINTAHSKGTDILISHYQFRDEQGTKESEAPLVHRSYIYLPAINDILKKEDTEKLNDFEKLCYLFKNGRPCGKIEAQGRLVKIAMKKLNKMQEDEEVWTEAMAAELGEKRYVLMMQDKYKEGQLAGIAEGRTAGIAEGKTVGIAEGKTEGKLNTLLQQIQLKYQVNASQWLTTLSDEQLDAIMIHILTCHTFEELHKAVIKK